MAKKDRKFDNHLKIGGVFFKLDCFRGKFVRNAPNLAFFGALCSNMTSFCSLTDRLRSETHKQIAFEWSVISDLR